jgi:hypothetical protein
LISGLGEAVKLLVDAKATLEVTVKGFEDIQGHGGAIKLLLSAKATAECQGNGIFQAINGLGEAARMLVDAKATVEAKVKRIVRQSVTAVRLPNCSCMPRPP